MSEYQPLTTAAELEFINEDECLDGYRAGLSDAPEPGSDKSRSYWHGWRNGMIDRGRLPQDEASASLAQSIVRKSRAH